MSIEDAVEALNQYIEDIRNNRNITSNLHLVVQRSIAPSEHFKAYKVYNITIWAVGSTKSRVLSYSYTDRLIEGQDESIIKRIEIYTLKDIYSIVNTELFESIINGEYRECYIGDQ